MNPADAFVVLARLAAGTDGWDEPRILLWVDKLGCLSNDRAVRHTVEAIVESWAGPGGPPWALFRQTYDSICRNERLEQRALPTARDAMTKGEYLDRLRQRAEAGDTAAIDELANWAKLRRTPVNAAVRTVMAGGGAA